jgi:hypothetical protein
MRLSFPCTWGIQSLLIGGSLMTVSRVFFYINNISDVQQEFMLSDINLVSTDDGHDLISGKEMLIQLAPYQTLWISNG